MLAAALFATPALAQPVDNTPMSAGGWQFAHWGMSRGEIEAAGAGKTHGAVEANADAIDGDYAIGSFKFQVVLAFDEDNSLKEVRLKPDFPAKQCGALKAYLRDQLGVPALEVDNEPKMTWWRDAPHGNAVKYGSDGAKSCELLYQPLSTLSIVG
jgi:hypothetical protein